MKPSDKSSDQRMLYGRIPINVIGKIDLEATAKVLAPIIIRQYEADQQALELRSQLHLVDIGEGVDPARVPEPDQEVTEVL